MGYCYTRSGALVCDCCNKSGGVKKRKCPIGWCPAPAACNECFKARKAKWEAYHLENCYPARECARAEEERRLTIHANNWLTIAAWGSWAVGVPEGMVGVVATKAGKREPGLEEKWFLVPAAAYETREGGYFVINPERHAEISRLSGASKEA